jgi:Ca2+-binding RTX toxin-like protein
LAFTTINGASATDRVSFVGTDGVDILTTFNTLTAFVGAQGANDSITVSNPAGLIDWQVKAGAGNDTIDFNSEMIGGRVNGNAGVDTIDMNRVVGNASVYGGQQDDFITAGDVANSRINGNLGNDTITVGKFAVVDAQNAVLAAAVADDVIFASIFGGQGADKINIIADQIQGTEIGGNLGNDTIDLFFNTGAIIEGVTVTGGEGDDTLRVQGIPFTDDQNNQKGSGEGITFDGGLGADTIIGSGRNDTIDGGAGVDTIRGRNGADKMSGGADNDKFLYGAAGATNGNAAAQTLAVTGTNIDATDVITDWTRDTAGAGVNNGDEIIVAVKQFLNTDAGIDVVTGATLKDVIATATSVYDAGIGALAAGANGVWLAAVGTPGSYTAYAIIVGETGAAPDAVASIGAVQLGLEGTFTSANINTALTADQIGTYA